MSKLLRIFSPAEEYTMNLEDVQGVGMSGNQFGIA